MFRNLFTIAYRSLLKRKFFTLINVTGLSVGFATCLLMLLHVRQELSYDKFHRLHERIVRIGLEIQSESETKGNARIPFPTKWILLNEYPEVEKVARIYGGNWLNEAVILKQGEKQFSEPRLLFADPEIFDVFDFKLLKGQPIALEQTESIVLTESMSRKYFGDADPIGQTINYQNSMDLQVTGVIEDVPIASHVHFDFLVPISLQRTLWKIPLNNNYDFEEDWKWSGAWTYVLLKPGQNIERFEERIQQIPKDLMSEDGSRKLSFIVQPLTDIHLNSNLAAEIEPAGSEYQVAGFIGIALLILSIAIMNFVNLATARSAERAKEVGMRKVMGAFKTQLVGQFLGEAIVVTMASIILAGFLAELFLPYFNSLMNTSVLLRIDYSLILILLLAAIGIGVIAGLYPAFFLSRFHPIKTLKGLIEKPSDGNLLLRKILVVLQFSISTLLVLGILVIALQLDFVRNKNLGFNAEQILVLPNGKKLIDGYPTFRQKVLAIPGVQEVYRGYIPGKYAWGGTTFVAEGREGQYAMGLRYVGSNFTSMFGLSILEGRDFKEDNTEAPGDGFKAPAHINEAAARLLQWTPEDALGKNLHFIGGSDNKTEYDLSIVGVINDANFESLHHTVQPLVFMNEVWGDIAIKISSTNASTVVSEVEKEWKRAILEWPFEYSFLDQDFNQLYAQEERLAKSITFFTALAIGIACMGLMGIVAFTTQQRAREIGIRKVLGASAFSIWFMITRNYVVLLGISFAISFPLGYYFANQWLQGFAYHIHLGASLFIGAAVIIIFIAVITVCWQSVKSALVRPVDLMRAE